MCECTGERKRAVKSYTVCVLCVCGPVYGCMSVNITYISKQISVKFWTKCV